MFICVSKRIKVLYVKNGLVVSCVTGFGLFFLFVCGSYALIYKKTASALCMPRSILQLVNKI